MVLHVIRADILLIARISQNIRAYYMQKPSIKIYVFIPVSKLSRIVQRKRPTWISVIINLLLSTGYHIFVWSTVLLNGYVLRLSLAKVKI